jgi:putative flippase GtrA
VSDTISRLKRLLSLKLRFAMASTVATTVDYVLYLALVYTFLTPVLSNIIAYSIAVLVNFILQKQFIFSLKRKLKTAFFLAMGVSLGGLIVGTSLIWLLIKIPFFDKYQFITKLCVTGILFFYNFYFKRYVFEKRFF